MGVKKKKASGNTTTVDPSMGALESNKQKGHLADLTKTIRDMATRLEETVTSLTDMSEEYFNAGLLAEHRDALMMRDKALKSLNEVRSKIGLKPFAPVVTATTVSPVSSEIKIQKENGAPCDSLGAPDELAEKGRVSSPSHIPRPLEDSSLTSRCVTKIDSAEHVDSSSVSRQNISVKAASSDNSGRSVTDNSERSGIIAASSVAPSLVVNRWHDSHAACEKSARQQYCSLQYRWANLEEQTAKLEIQEPQGIDHVADVNLADSVIRVAWKRSSFKEEAHQEVIMATDDCWQLNVPTPFSVDIERSTVSRKRKTGILVISLKRKANAPSTRDPARQPDPAHQLERLLFRDLCCGHSASSQKDHSTIATRGISVIESFLPGPEADAVRDRVLELWEEGHLEVGEVEGGVKAHVRSDVYANINEHSPENKVIADYFTSRLDRLVLDLVNEAGKSSSPESVFAKRRLVRGRPMVAVYPGGCNARYTPHYDCVHGDNGRILTAILYLNPFWRTENLDGGSLRIWPEAILDNTKLNVTPKALEPRGQPLDVEPLHGRLCVFMCDSRNLHAVLPVTSSNARIAISCWYYDGCHLREEYSKGA